MAEQKEWDWIQFIVHHSFNFSIFSVIAFVASGEIVSELRELRKIAAIEDFAALESKQQCLFALLAKQPDLKWDEKDLAIFQKMQKGAKGDFEKSCRHYLYSPHE